MWGRVLAAVALALSAVRSSDVDALRICRLEDGLRPPESPLPVRASFSFIGKGGHGGMPYTANDPLPTGALFASGLDVLYGRHRNLIDPKYYVRYSIERVSSPESYNVIPAQFDVTVLFEGPYAAGFFARAKKWARHIASGFDQSVQAVERISVEKHDGAILSADVSSSGRSFLTSSIDSSILISSTATGDEIARLKGHKRAVTQARYSEDRTRVFSASADTTCAVWDTEYYTKISALRGHEDIVNACSVSRTALHPTVFVSGGDDGETMVFDVRARSAVASFPNKYQVLAVAFDESRSRVFAGCLDNSIRVYDVRRATTSESDLANVAPLAQIFELCGHTHMVTGLDLSYHHDKLVSFSADQTIRVWDVRELASAKDACIRAFRGPTHNFEQVLHRVRFSPDGHTVAAGSADRLAHVISVEHVAAGVEPSLLARLDGHRGAVTDIGFHPTKPIIVSVGVDGIAIIHKFPEQT